MRVYSSEQNGRFFLSPYVQVIYTDGCFTLCQELFHSWVSIPCTGKAAQTLLSAFKNGADEETLIALLIQAGLDRDNAENDFALLQQAGVLE